MSTRGIATERRPPRLTLDGLHEGTVRLEADDAHYLRSVLRLEVGDALTLYDGRGREADGRVATLSRDAVSVEVGALRAQPAPALRLSVGVAVPKRDRADWLVEKLTELGVTEIVWLACERSVAVPRSGSERGARWQRLARAAATQCGRADLPTIRGPEPLTQFLASPAERRFVGDAGGASLVDQVRDGIDGTAALAIGPEGGFTETELDATETAGCIPVRLGAHILRVETAAVAGAAVLIAAGSAP